MYQQFLFHTQRDVIRPNSQCLNFHGFETHTFRPVKPNPAIAFVMSLRLLFAASSTLRRSQLAGCCNVRRHGEGFTAVALSDVPPEARYFYDSSRRGASPAGHKHRAAGGPKLRKVFRPVCLDSLDVEKSMVGHGGVDGATDCFLGRTRVGHRCF